MNIKLKKSALKTFQSFDANTKNRIIQALKALLDGDIRPLLGYTGLYRLRIGRFRIIISYPDKDTALVEKIAPRGDVYKGGL